MLFLKRCYINYNSSLSSFNTSWFIDNLKFSQIFKLSLRLHYGIEHKFLFILNTYEAIKFFSIKKFLENSFLYSFRVLKIYGLGFKVSSSNNVIKLDLGWSHALFRNIPNNVSVLKKQDKLLVYGALKNKVFNFTDILISLYIRSAYQIKGLFDIHEKLKKKVGKQRQK